MGQERVAPRFITPKADLNTCIKLGIKSPLAFEAALGYYGLSRFSWTEFPQFIQTWSQDHVKIMDAGYFVLFTPTLICDEMIDDERAAIKITSPESAICDCLYYDIGEESVVQALDDLYNWESSIIDEEKLERLVDEYGIRDKFDPLKEEVKAT